MRSLLLMLLALAADSTAAVSMQLAPAGERAARLEQSVDLISVQVGGEQLPERWLLEDGVLSSAAGAGPLASRFAWDRPGEVRVTLSLASADATAASLVLGASHLGFAGRSGRPFVEGPLFGGATRFLEARPPAAGEELTARVVRTAAGRVEVYLRGERCFEGPGQEGSWGEVALRPQRDRLRVTAWCRYPAPWARPPRFGAAGTAPTPSASRR
jgi:hypothetical protein